MLDDPTLERVTGHPEELRSIDDGVGRLERFDAERPLDRGKIEGLDDDAHAAEYTRFRSVART